MQSQARDTSRQSTIASRPHLRKSLNKRRLALVLMVDGGAAWNEALATVASIWALGRHERSIAAYRGWTMKVYVEFGVARSVVAWGREHRKQKSKRRNDE
mmetsp:Transcript_22176/g.44527  ORF Transcript_22176/g.44527 Transcript_22176/m.44527 type:complete len:100 (+) Transcript_22176:4219-4518(+)